ncbi:hypothetical protein [Kitasatospora sp. NPDC088346]|uniref:hypothetical protein n=1 Tax=Kitasatospora sp. NPDC088346 TaxID=3364073 RepID=UPI00382F429E
MTPDTAPSEIKTYTHGRHLQVSDRGSGPDGSVEDHVGATPVDPDTGLLDDSAYDDVITRSVN